MVSGQVNFQRRTSCRLTRLMAMSKRVSSASERRGYPKHRSNIARFDRVTCLIRTTSLRNNSSRTLLGHSFTSILVRPVLPVGGNVCLCNVSTIYSITQHHRASRLASSVESPLGAKEPQRVPNLCSSKSQLSPRSTARSLIP